MNSKISRAIKAIKNNFYVSIFILSAVAGILSFYHYYSIGEHLMYGDARSHLNIARRVVDSTHPGLAQLGGVWLPLLHVLMLPTISSDFFWHSGLSGALINFWMFMLAVYFLFKIGEMLFESKFIQLLVPLLYILNPNILYMSTTAMTEVLFIATFTGAIYFLLKWITNHRLLHLISSGLFILLTSINRYEGWFIVLGSIFTVVLISFVQGMKKNKIEGNFIVFSSLAGVGIFFWLIWQLAIFGDPLYFLHSIYSAKYQTQAGFQVVGTRSEIMYHNPILAPLGYLYAVIANTGIIVTTAGILGAITCLLTLPFIRKHTIKHHYYLLLFLLLTPFIFESFAIFKGNVPLHVPEINSGTFNIRLGMYVIPSATVLLLLLVKKLPLKTITLMILLVTQFLLFYPTFTKPITLQAASEGIKPKIEAARWLRSNYKGGKILASSATGDPLLFDSGLNLKEFINDGSADLFNSALAHPQSKARYIVLINQVVDRKRDLVYRTLSDEKKKIRKYYSTVFNNSAFEILERTKN